MDTGKCTGWRRGDGPFPRPPFDPDIGPWAPAVAYEVCSEHTPPHHRTIFLLFNWRTFQVLDPLVAPGAAMKIVRSVAGPKAPGGRSVEVADVG